MQNSSSASTKFSNLSLHFPIDNGSFTINSDTQATILDQSPHFCGLDKRQGTEFYGYEVDIRTCSHGGWRLYTLHGLEWAAHGGQPQFRLGHHQPLPASSAVSRFGPSAYFPWVELNKVTINLAARPGIAQSFGVTI